MLRRKEILLVFVSILCSIWLIRRFRRNLYRKTLSSPLPTVVVLLQINPTTNFRALQETVRSIRRQEGDYKFDLVVLDLYCMNSIRGMLSILLHGTTTKIIHICDHTESDDIKSSYEFIATYKHAINSDWVLFLQAGLSFEPNFIQGLLEVTQSTPDVDASGCKVIWPNNTNSKLRSAASILWNDGSIQPYGVDDDNISSNADEVSYARQVDFVSEACLLIRSDVLSARKMDSTNIPDAYDYQMEIAMNRGKHIWYSPVSVAYDFMDVTTTHAPSILNDKWKGVLSAFPEPPQTNFSNDHDLLRARDTRRRKEGSINILYIDDRFPNRNAGSGYGRAVDNLLMMTDLGHCITVTAAYDEGCDTKCKQGLQMYGLEIVHQSSLSSLLESRKGFYEIIIVSRPSTYAHVHSILHKAVSKMETSILYDAEALWYRRDEKLLDLYELGYDAPGAKKYMETFDKKVHDEKREMEIALLQDPDVITTVTHLERSIILNLTYGSNTPHVSVIGHIMDTNNPTQATFKERIGVMFLAAYSNVMYYNGDAIWGFLDTIYPEILKESPVSIPVTVAGRGIPKELHDFVNEKCTYCQNVTVLESPKNIRVLYNKARVFIAPHLYGAGVQYKLSEAFAAGVPVVMSLDTANNMGFLSGGNHSAGCIGESSAGFSECVLKAHNDPSYWNHLREEGMTFIRETHQKTQLRQLWNESIHEGLRRLRQRQECQTSSCDQLPGMLFKVPMTKKCLDLEMSYLNRYPQVKKLLVNKTYLSGIDHFIHTPAKDGFILDLESEQKYLASHKKVQDVIKKGGFVSAWHHFKSLGAEEGKVYSSKDDKQYLNTYEDIANAVKNKALKIGWIHFDLWGGREEGRRYGCF